MKRLRVTAIHEAGHAVAAARLGCGLVRATIVPQGDSLGHVRRHKLPRTLFEAVEFSIPTPAQRAKIESHLVYTLAGPAAEARHRKRRNLIGASGDHGIVTELAMRLQPHDKVRDAWIRYLELSADALMEARWDEVVAVADALLEKGTLRRDDVFAAMRATYARTVPTPVPTPTVKKAD